MTTFLDDYSKFYYVYLLHSDEALDKFKIYKNELELKLELHVKRLRMDK